MITNPFERNSIFIWNVPAIEGGDPQKIAALLKAHGFTSVMPKVTDGTIVHKPNLLSFPLWLNKPNVDKTFVDVMHANDIAVIGWSFNYGNDGDGEGRIAAQQCDALGLDGWVWDVESRFEDRTDRVARAGQVVGTFRKTLVNKIPTALCTWAHFKSYNTGGTWHPTDLPHFWAGFVDYFMPMIYWSLNGAVLTDDNVEFLTKASLDQWRIYVGDKPFVPAGRAYTGDGNTVIPDNMIAFYDYAMTRSVGATWWVLDSAKKIPDVMDTFKDLNDIIVEPPAPPDPLPAAPVSSLLSINPKPLVSTDIMIETKVNGVPYWQALTYTPAVTPPPVDPPVEPPTADFPHLYRIKDDFAAGVEPTGTRPYIRNGLPATVRMRGVSSAFKLPQAWIDFVSRCNGGDKKRMNYLFKPASGWQNGDEQYKVETLTFAGNVVNVTRIDGNKAYIQSYHTNETPPAGAITPRENSLHPLVQMFSVGYNNKSKPLDMSTDGRYCLTLILVPAGESPWIDLRDLDRLP